MNSKKELTDEQILFMVNTAEQVGRPKDMLMFLGEYFKCLIDQTTKIEAIIQQNQQGYANKVQQDFFITHDVLNSLGSACKMYIDPPRQELRIAIALARNPLFKEDQEKTLHAQIRRSQKTIINRCIKLIKFIDYLHDRRRIVPLKYTNSQPPNCVLSAVLYKMKADYMHFIFECLAGENGALKDDTILKKFVDVVDERESKEISDE